MKELTLIGGLSSYGMAYTKDNHDHMSFFRLLSEDLMSQFDVRTIDLFRIAKNCNWDLEHILVNNPTLAQLQQEKNNALSKMREGGFMINLFIDKDYKPEPVSNYYSDSSHITDIIKESTNPIFIYTIGINDFFTGIKSGPFELVLSADNIERAGELNSNDYYSLIDRIIQYTEKNIKLLLEINPEIRIILMGVFDSFIYRIIDRVAKNKVRIIPDLIYYYNSQLKVLAEANQSVQYLPIDEIENETPRLDFHPSRKGHLAIESKLKSMILEKSLTDKKK